MIKFKAELLRLRSSRLAHNAGWLLAGQGLGLVLQAVYFVVLARLLGPVQYGVFAGSFALAALVAQYSPLGTGTLFLRYVTADHSKFSEYWGNLLVVTTVVGAALVLALQLLGPRLLNPASAALVLFAAVGNCLCGQLTIEAARVFQTFEQMRFTALLNLLTSLVRTIAAASMLWAMHQATAWQWAVVAMSVSALASLATVVTITVKFGTPTFSLKLFREHNSEGMGYAVAMSTSSIYNDVDKIMLSHYGMNLANGVYSMAYRIIDIATIPIFSLRDAAMPRFFKAGQSGVDASAELAMRLLRRAVPLAATASVVLFVAAPLVPRIAGRGFSEGIAAVQFLCLIPLLRSFHQMTGCALTGAGLQRFRTSTQFAAAAINFGLNLWLIPTHGWRGAAATSLITDACLGVMNWSILRVRISKHSTEATSSTAGRLLRWPFRIARALRFRSSIGRLMLLNRFGRARVATGSDGPVVSLTTYGERAATVQLTIESIARGQQRPSRLILWLDETDLYDHLSAPLARLQRRGLEIRKCANYGPHKKYFPYVEETSSFSIPLVTADDDVIYPASWLSGLVAAQEAFPSCVSCYRARQVLVQDRKLAPYREWPLCASTTPSSTVIATGVSGVIYPPALLSLLKREGNSFLSRCPRADDIWLHVQALRGGFMVHQIQEEAVHFPHIPGSQESSLYSENCENEDGNDRQSAATYEQNDIALLAASPY